MDYVVLDNGRTGTTGFSTIGAFGASRALYFVSADSLWRLPKSSCDQCPHSESNAVRVPHGLHTGLLHFFSTERYYTFPCPSLNSAHLTLVFMEYLQSLASHLSKVIAVRESAEICDSNSRQGLSSGPYSEGHAPPLGLSTPTNSEVAHIRRCFRHAPVRPL